MTTTPVVDADGVGAKTRQFARRSSDSAVGYPSELRSTGKCAGRVRRLCATMGAFLPQDLLVDPD